MLRLPTLIFFLLVVGQGAAAPRHVRGEAGGAESEERRNGVENEQRVLPTLADYDIKGEDKYSSCPEGYPAFGTLGDLLTAWSPNQPEVPEGGVIERLRVLNYSDPEQLAMATTLRNCEVPFKVIGVPEAEAASAKWTDDYLETELKVCPRCNVMRSDSNRFMFWHKKRGTVDEGWTPPTSPQNMRYREWRQWTREADANKTGPTGVHYYLTTGVAAQAKTPPTTGEFVADDLPFFSTRKENFFIPDVAHQKGIQCRFGARGIIAESHFDHGKNFVLMLRGRKRYLLNPPRACPVLDIISDKTHPSFRHSDVDWSDEADWPEGFADAPALETVLEAGELLYIPSFWYHYIVSEGFNVQCNARSGLSLRQEWVTQTEECMGRDMPAAAAAHDQGRSPAALRYIKYKEGRGKDGRRERGRGGAREGRGAERGSGRGSSKGRGHGKREDHP